MTSTTPAKMPAMNPRAANRLTEDTIRRLREARQTAADADAALRASVRAALDEGSVRQVAAALEISPTTVHKWSKEERDV